MTITAEVAKVFIANGGNVELVVLEVELKVSPNARSAASDEACTQQAGYPFRRGR